MNPNAAGHAPSAAMPVEAPLKGISSMATRALLAELLQVFAQRPPGAAAPLQIESVGGVDAARRVQGGEAFDLVLLASDAIQRLEAAGATVPGSQVDFVRSPAALAVREGGSSPDISSEAALRQTLTAAASIGFSTGPSGNFLQQLLQRWGVFEQLQPRLVQAPPGVPVGKLVAEGGAALGLQQLSELMNVPGIQVLGVLPPGADFITTFSAALCRAGQRPAAAQAFFDFLNAPETADIKRRHGMQPL